MDAGDVRVEIYRSFKEEGRAPVPDEIARRLGAEVGEVESALRELHADDVIALVPGTHLVWLAHPFSALDSAFRVTARGREWDAICVWDALGVLALLGCDGSVSTLCPDCGKSLVLEVAGGETVPSDFVVHFGVPANRWYEDVAYT